MPSSPLPSTIVPRPLVNALGLDHGVQQDAQEFWKLFWHMIEQQLKSQVCPALLPPPIRCPLAPWPLARALCPPLTCVPRPCCPDVHPPSQGNDAITTLFDRVYVGEMYNRTICDNCQRPSDRPDSFTELQLPMGKKAATVEECLRGLLETERLEDSNKYFCSRCNEKHNASRRMVLKRLPDTLNLQLLRCVSAEKGKAKEWAEKREVKNMAKRAPE